MKRPQPTVLAWWIWAATVVLVIALALMAARDAGSWQLRAAVRTAALPTQGQGVVFDCRQLAEVIEAISIYRDAGAELEKTLEIVKPRVDATGEYWDALEREIRRMWREGLPAELAALRTFERCREQLGDMGRAT